MFVLFLAVLSVFAAAKVDDDCVVCSFIVEQLQKEIDTEREAVKIGAKKWQKVSVFVRWRLTSFD